MFKKLYKIIYYKTLKNNSEQRLSKCQQPWSQNNYFNNIILGLSKNSRFTL